MPVYASDSMTSDVTPEPLFLDRDLSATAEDVAALGRVPWLGTLDTAFYLDFLLAFEPPSAESLRTRAGPRGPRFELRDA